MNESKKFSQRDNKAEEVKTSLTSLGLRFLSEVVDVENNDKKLTFQYGPVSILVGVRSTCQRYVVLATGAVVDSYFMPMPEGFTKVADGVRIGKKGKSYPKTLEHAVDQVKLFINKIDQKS